MARYLLKSDTVLSWLSDKDPAPLVLPEFPKQRNMILVVAYLLAGKVVAEAVLSPQHLRELCGPGLPLGRLYFQVQKTDVQSLCPEVS
jgi:hypothetical protein